MNYFADDGNLLTHGPLLLQYFLTAPNASHRQFSWERVTGARPSEASKISPGLQTPNFFIISTFRLLLGFECNSENLKEVFWSHSVYYVQFKHQDFDRDDQSDSGFGERDCTVT